MSVKFLILVLVFGLSVKVMASDETHLPDSVKEVINEILVEDQYVGASWKEEYLEDEDILLLVEKKMSSSRGERRGPPPGGENERPENHEDQERPRPNQNQNIKPQLEKLLADESFLLSLKEVIASKNSTEVDESVDCRNEIESDVTESMGNIKDLNLIVKEALEDPSLRKELIAELKKELKEELKEDLKDDPQFSKPEARVAHEETQSKIERAQGDSKMPSRQMPTSNSTNVGVSNAMPRSGQGQNPSSGTSNNSLMGIGSSLASMFVGGNTMNTSSSYGSTVPSYFGNSSSMYGYGSSTPSYYNNSSMYGYGNSMGTSMYGQSNTMNSMYGYGTTMPSTYGYASTMGSSMYGYGTTSMPSMYSYGTQAPSIYNYGSSMGNMYGSTNSLYSTGSALGTSMFGTSTTGLGIYSGYQTPTSTVPSYGYNFLN
jgi:hypothetical protein